MELADMVDSKSTDGNIVRVQVPYLTPTAMLICNKDHENVNAVFKIKQKIKNVT